MVDNHTVLALLRLVFPLSQVAAHLQSQQRAGSGGRGGGNTLYGLLRKQPLAPRRNYGALKNAAAAAAAATAANDGVRQPIIILSKALIDFSIGGVYCRSKTCVNAALCSHSSLPVGGTSAFHRSGGKPCRSGLGDTGEFGI